MTRLPRSQSGRPIKGASLSTTPSLLQTLSRTSPILSTMLTHRSSAACHNHDSSSRASEPGEFFLVLMVNTTSSAYGSSQPLRNPMGHTRSPQRRRCAAHGILRRRNSGRISVEFILAFTTQRMEHCQTPTVAPIDAAGKDALGLFLSALQKRRARIYENTSQNLQKRPQRLNKLAAGKPNLQRTRGTTHQ